jgi:hypothetical protein
MKFTWILGALTALGSFGPLSYALQQNTHSQLKGIRSQMSQIRLLGQETLTVVDKAGKAIPNATILLGYEVGDPFDGNQLTTDDKGVAMAPGEWKAALPLTVQAPGYVTTTLPAISPGSMTIEINKQEGAADLAIKGFNTGFCDLKEDGKVDFGLVIPALSRESMLSFDLSTVISPKSDKITVVGEDVEIPSNITLPKQTENYIFDITLDKPAYRLYVREPGNYQVYASHGQFPLQKVVSAIRNGKSMFDVINYFSFMSGGQLAVDVQADVENKDVPIDQIAYNQKVSVTAPVLGKSQVMISVALMDSNGMMMPTDLKRLASGKAMSLNASGNAPSVLSVLMNDANKKVQGTVLGTLADQMFAGVNVAQQYMMGFGQSRRAENPQDFSQLSISLMPAGQGVAPQFLDLTDKPTYADYVLSMKQPTLPDGMQPVATYMVLSEVESIMEGKISTERRTRIWEVWSDAWLDQMELPKIAINKNPKRKYRWEVMFLARPAGALSSARPGVMSVDLNTVTNITRNALEI